METLPWWRSRIIIGALISIICKVLVTTGVIGDMSGLDTDQLTDALLLVIGLTADAWIIRERVVQKTAPAIVGKTA